MAADTRSSPSVRAAAPRMSTMVSGIDQLVGAHVDTLTELFLRGRAVEAVELPEQPRGCLLAVSGTQGAHLLTRPLTALLSRKLLRWQGLSVDSGGKQGTHRFAGRQLVRFDAREGASRLDAGPALVLSHEQASAPFRSIRTEMRLVAPGVALGPTYWREQLLAWLALEVPGAGLSPKV